MAQAAKKLTPIRPQTLPELIDHAGRLNVQKTAIENEYKAARREIEALLTIPDGQDKVVECGETHEAVYEYPVSTQVDILALFEETRELFFQLVKIPVGDLKLALDPIDFHRLTSPQRSNATKLTIQKKGKDAA
jgi:hypothetical protein